MDVDEPEVDDELVLVLLALPDVVLLFDVCVVPPEPEPGVLVEPPEPEPGVLVEPPEPVPGLPLPPPLLSGKNIATIVILCSIGISSDHSGYHPVNV